MDTGVIHRLAIICKDHYVIRTINDLFVYAGAEQIWWTQPKTMSASERITHFYGWIEGIQSNAPEQMNTILQKVALEIIRNEHIPDHDRLPIKHALMDLGQQELEKEGIQLDPLLATLARMLANDGLTRELAIITNAAPRLEWNEHDRLGDVDVYSLILSIPFKLYAQIEAEREHCEQLILARLHRLLISVPKEDVSRVVIAPKLLDDEQWREKALAWLTGEKVNNQGRVRSDNVAPRTVDGLQFRSQPEIYLYRALKALGVSFAPLPVFVRGGEEYRRIEPDFVILKGGVVMVVEVDGDTFHHETPSEAHNRTTMLMHEGAHIERINASQCDTPEKAAICARRLLDVIAKLKDSRR